MPTYGDGAGAPGITARDHQKKNVRSQVTKVFCIRIIRNREESDVAAYV
jgi:hypothetical protein